MSGDLAMVKGAVGGHDLAIGEPELLRPLWEEIQANMEVPDFGVGYPRLGGEPQMIELLRKLQPEYNHFVVSNGAKQGIVAALTAYRNRNPIRVLECPRPYWPTHKTIAENLGLLFNPVQHAAHLNPSKDQTISILTLPNNPDGSQDIGTCDVWDAAYAHPLYGWKGQTPRHGAAVFSLTKLIGSSNIRFGWIATNDEGIAREAALCIESTTSGVSRKEQEIAYAALSYLYDKNLLALPGSGMEDTEDARRLFMYATHYLAANNEMVVNANRLQEELKGYLSELDGGCRRGGMFAWVKAADPPGFEACLDETKIKMLDGRYCGQAGWFRINLSKDPIYFRALIRKLKFALDCRYDR